MVVEFLQIPGGLLTALLYNVMSRTISQLVFFVPGNIGVMELSSATVFAALGLDANAGLQIALALRFTYFFNLLVGYGALSRLHLLSKHYPAQTTERDETSDAT